MNYEQNDRAIDKANEGLNRVKIVRRDRKLALRGTVPCKPGETAQKRRRYIALGIYANPDGVKVARAKSRGSLNSATSAYRLSAFLVASEL